MSPVIPDPEKPRLLGLREDGKIMYAVYSRPLGDDGEPVGDWQQSGWHDPEKFAIEPLPEEEP